MLTETLKILLNHIIDFTLANEKSPTVREVCKILNNQNPSSIHRKIKLLAERGYIEHEAGVTRGIKVLRKPGDSVGRLPGAGRIESYPTVQKIKSKDLRTLRLGQKPAGKEHIHKFVGAKEAQQ